MIKITQPMLACSLMEAGDEHTDEAILKRMKMLRYPVACTLKKDGIRALRLNGTLLSRTLKEIPNKSVRQRSMVLPGGIDMELWNPDLTYDEIESIVMSREHERSDDIQFHLLDQVTSAGYMARIAPLIQHYMFKEPTPSVNVEVPLICKDANELMERFKQSEEIMGEGVCFRLLMSPYKQGRSTFNEQYLMKLCRFTREEVTIGSVIEQRDKRDHPMGMMGALGCKRENGDTTIVGTGFNTALRKKIWADVPAYIGQQITIKYKGHGMKDKLRAPVFVGFRKEGQ